MRWIAINYQHIIISIEHMPQKIMPRMNSHRSHWYPHSVIHGFKEHYKEPWFRRNGQDCQLGLNQDGLKKECCEFHRKHDNCDECDEPGVLSAYAKTKPTCSNWGVDWSKTGNNGNVSSSILDNAGSPNLGFADTGSSASVMTSYFDGHGAVGT